MVSQDLKEISVEEADTAELLLLYSYLLKQGIKPIWPNIKETFDHFVPKYWFFNSLHAIAGFWLIHSIIHLVKDI